MGTVKAFAQPGSRIVAHKEMATVMLAEMPVPMEAMSLKLALLQNFCVLSRNYLRLS